MKSIVSFLSHNKLRYKKSGKDHVEVECPKCGKMKLYINLENGKSFCFKCGKGFRSLQDLAIFHKLESVEVKPIVNDEQIEQFQLALFSDKDSLHYLRKRGFNDDSVKKFGLGSITKDGRIGVTIPHIFNHEVEAIKIRFIDSLTPKYKYLQSYEIEHPYVPIELDENKDFILITEGELNVIAGYQIGLSNIIATCGSSKTDYDYSFLANYAYCYLLVDNDVAGRKFAKSIGDKLGRTRCYPVSLPKKDLAECLETGIDKAQIIDVLKKAKAHPLEVLPSHTLNTVSERTNELFDNPFKQNGTFITGLNRFNQLTNGIRKRELITLLAGEKNGKTTFSCWMASQLAKNGWKPVIISPEMQPEDIAYLMTVGIHGGIPTKFERERITKEFDGRIQIADLFAEFTRKSLFDSTCEFIDYYARRGFNFFVLDYFELLCEDSENMDSASKKYIKRLLYYISRYDITIWNIMQPKVVIEDRPLEPRDAKFGGAARAGSHMFFILNRQFRDSNGIVELNLARKRNRTATEGVIPLQFDLKTKCIYSEVQ